jgi:glycosyltransferase involved in cell wall biosynthesis
VVAVNRYLEVELRNLFSLPDEKLVTINNFVSFPEGKIITVKKPQGYFRLVTVGRLDPLKNHTVLIEMLPRLKILQSNVQLVIIGAGTEYDALQLQAKQLGLSFSNDCSNSSDVIFTGFNANPYPILSSSDVFVFPTKTEGLPLVLVEAMYAGLPIVSSDCPTGGASLILDGNNKYIPGRTVGLETAYGYLMPIPQKGEEKTQEQWIEVIIELLQNKIKRSEMCEQAKKRALDFSQEKAKAQWTDLMNSLQ